MRARHSSGAARVSRNVCTRHGRLPGLLPRFQEYRYNSTATGTGQSALFTCILLVLSWMVLILFSRVVFGWGCEMAG